MHKLDSHSTWRNILHWCRAPSWGCCTPYCRNAWTPSILFRLEIFTFLCHSFAIATRKASSVFMLPSGASCTPSVWRASVILSHWMVFWSWSVSRMESVPGVWLIPLYLHVLFFHSKLIRYQKHFSGTSTPPVACSNPSQCVTDSCRCLTTCAALSELWVTQRLVSSTNAKPNLCLFV